MKKVISKVQKTKAEWNKRVQATLKTNGYKNTSELFEKLNIQVNIQVGVKM